MKTFSQIVEEKIERERKRKQKDHAAFLEAVERYKQLKNKIA